MHHIVNLAAESASQPNNNWIAGAIAMGIFILLAVVTWSYRDVANRHDHKTSNHSGH